MSKPTISNTKSSTKARKATAHTPGLHYNKEELLHDYQTTFHFLVRALAIGVGGAIIYFFGMILYLGAYGQTKADEYVREFPDFAQEYGYKGTKLPEFADPAAYIAEHPTANEKH